MSNSSRRKRVNPRGGGAVPGAGSKDASEETPALFDVPEASGVDATDADDLDESADVATDDEPDELPEAVDSPAARRSARRRARAEADSDSDEEAETPAERRARRASAASVTRRSDEVLESTKADVDSDDNADEAPADDDEPAADVADDAHADDAHADDAHADDVQPVDADDDEDRDESDDDVEDEADEQSDDDDADEDEADEDDADEDDADEDEADEDDDEPLSGKSVKSSKVKKAGSGTVAVKSRPVTKKKAPAKSSGGPARFLREVTSELSKVIWPTRKQMWIYGWTVVVFVVLLVAAVGFFDLGVQKGMVWLFG